MLTYQRVPVVGQCLQGWHNMVALVDQRQEVRSGDLCRVVVDYADGRVASVIKRLEVDSRDRWWIACDDAAAQIGRYVTPRCVERVVGREPALLNLDHVPVAPPDEHTRTVAARWLAELRADQLFHGRRVGVPFPHATLTRPRVFGRTPETARSTLPDSDVQQPSTPLNFSLVVVGNMINFDWDDSEILPVGTRYELYSSPTSLSDATSKTRLWAGADTGKTLAFSATSAAYFQIRAVHGSYVSGFSPNTFGVAAVPIYTPPAEPSSGSWSLSLSPTAIYKTQVGTSTITTGPATGAVVGSASAVFSWTWTGSAIGINSPGANATTFVASGMTLNEMRFGTAWLNVADGANTSSKSIGITILREPPEGGG